MSNCRWMSCNSKQKDQNKSPNECILCKKIKINCKKDQWIYCKKGKDQNN